MENMIRKVLKVDGMSCVSCERKIETKLRNLDGVFDVKASFGKSTVEIGFDENSIKIYEIVEEIEKLDYPVKDIKDYNSQNKNSDNSMSIIQLLGVGTIIFALYLIIKNTIGFNFIPQVDKNMSYGILFIVGLLTSLHCLAMCGGINISQCISHGDSGTSSKIMPSFLYNMGRVVSYTVIGGIVGVIGSAVTLTGSSKGIVAIIAGVFMAIMGINMLNIFPWLRRLNPRMPKFLANRVAKVNSKRPFFIGLLNGLMPCGPLQAMQLYALGTGSFIAGALSMLFFSLGTVPLMFGLGAVSTLLSKKFTNKMLKASAVLVLVLGIIMVNRGLNLSGVSFAAGGPTSGNVAKLEGDVQVISTKIESGSYSPIIVQKGIPVKWTINATEEDLNGCNNPITIPKYNKEIKLVPGANLVEFTPEEAGNITYTCWMGMISSTIKVVDDVGKVSDKDIQQITQDETSTAGGSCCSAGAKATKFSGGAIPVDTIAIAKIENGEQSVPINVNDYGFEPAVIVVQKGIKTKWTINGEKLNYCNNRIALPDYNYEIELKQGKNDIEFVPERDFSYRCWMGMLNGYVKVVDDINKVNLEEIKQEVLNNKPTGGSSGGCCGS